MDTTGHNGAQQGASKHNHLRIALGCVNIKIFLVDLNQIYNTCSRKYFVPFVEATQFRESPDYSFYVLGSSFVFLGKYSSSFVFLGKYNSKLCISG